MIYKLPVDVYQRIKAGEVIEDPSSVVRELLDNALDAGATQIVVEIQSGGFDKIQVKDNGTGISFTDLEICFLEHTTSKIQSFEDIARLQTNGFRGEALASICRVAHVNILSATKEQKISEKIWVDQGAIQKHIQLAHRQGTVVEVQDLFYNLPVRRSFLRSKTREVAKIKREVLQKALAFPDITFQLLSENKTLLLCMPQDPKNRLLALTHVKNPLHTLEFEEGDLCIRGFITGIDQVFDSSNELFMFLNHRPFQTKSVYGTMKRALSQLIPRHKYLGGAIYIKTPPFNIDPNVHPAKKELKIYNEDLLSRGLYLGLRSIFYSSSYKTFLDLPQTPQDTPSVPPSTETTKIPNIPFPSSPIFMSSSEETVVDPTPPSLLPISENIHHSLPEEPYRYIGVYQGTYWIVEKDRNILLIDFHAAHERMRYENLKKQLNERSLEIQPLLTPDIISVSENTWGVLEASKDLLSNVGFEIDLLGDFNIVIRTVPNVLGENPTRALIEFLEDCHGSNSPDLSDIQDRWLKFAACRKSYMANDRVPEAEIHSLLKKIFQKQFPLTCPHGRPFIFTLPYQTVAGHFLR